MTEYRDILAIAVFVVCLGALTPCLGDIVINEFMADNESLENSLDKTPDWIEIYNDSGRNLNWADGDRDNPQETYPYWHRLYDRIIWTPATKEMYLRRIRTLTDTMLGQMVCTSQRVVHSPRLRENGPCTARRSGVGGCEQLSLRRGARGEVATWPSPPGGQKKGQTSCWLRYTRNEQNNKRRFGHG